MRTMTSPFRGRIIQVATTACLTLLLILLATWINAAAARESKPEPALPAINSFVQAADKECERYKRCDADSKLVFANVQVNSLDSSLEAPNRYLIRGWFNLNWLPAAHPNWKPSDLSLGCRSTGTGCKFSGWQNTFSSNSGQRIVWGARFELEVEEHDTYFNYPFDQHWIKVVIQPNGPQSYQFINNIDIDSFEVALAENLFRNGDDNFKIDYATVGTKANSFLIKSVTTNPTVPALEQSLEQSTAGSSPEQVAGRESHNKPAQDLPLDNKNDYLTTSFSLHLARRTPPALVMIITPLLLILFTTIIGFHWRESSPASRFGASGLLSAVSLYFASRVFRPAVDYLVFSDIWFLLDYVAITINSALLVWLFRYYKNRAEQKKEGKTPAPVWKAENMLTIWSVSTIFAVIAVMFVISQRMMQPPSIPTEFLAGNSNQEDHGTSVVKVIEQNQLLPSYFLLPITSRSEHSEF